MEALEKTYETAERVVKDGERMLRRLRNADPNEEVEYGGGTYTISQIEEMVENAREAHETHIPERVRQLRKTEEFEAARVRNLEQVKQMYPWVSEEGELKTAFESIRDKYLPAVRDHIPDILPFFDVMIADHFQAVQQRQNPQKPQARETNQRSVKQRPPANPGGSAAASVRPASSSERKSKMLESFSESGRSMSGSDLEQFLATS